MSSERVKPFEMPSLEELKRQLGLANPAIAALVREHFTCLSAESLQRLYALIEYLNDYPAIMALKDHRELFATYKRLKRDFAQLRGQPSISIQEIRAMSAELRRLHEGNLAHTASMPAITASSAARATATMTSSATTSSVAARPVATTTTMTTTTTTSAATGVPQIVSMQSYNQRVSRINMARALADSKRRVEFIGQDANANAKKQVFDDLATDIFFEFNSIDLIQIEQTLRNIRNYFDLWANDCNEFVRTNKGVIPLSFITFISDLQSKVACCEMAIADSMFNRLKAAQQKRDLRFDDYVGEIFRCLEDLGVKCRGSKQGPFEGIHALWIKASAGLEPFETQLSLGLIAEFIHYIQENGSGITKARATSELSFLQQVNSTQEPVKFIKRGELLIPKCLAKPESWVMATEPNSVLQRDKASRYQLMRAMQPQFKFWREFSVLINILERISASSNPLEEADDNEVFIWLENASKKIQEQQDRLSHEVKQNLSVETNDFLTAYQVFVTQEKTKITDFIQRYAGQIAHRLVLSIDTDYDFQTYLTALSRESFERYKQFVLRHGDQETKTMLTSRINFVSDFVDAILHTGLNTAKSFRSSDGHVNYPLIQHMSKLITQFEPGENNKYSNIVETLAKLMLGDVPPINYLDEEVLKPQMLNPLAALCMEIYRPLDVQGARSRAQELLNIIAVSYISSLNPRQKTVHAQRFLLRFNNEAAQFTKDIATSNKQSLEAVLARITALVPNDDVAFVNLAEVQKNYHNMLAEEKHVIAFRDQVLAFIQTLSTLNVSSLRDPRVIYFEEFLRHIDPAIPEIITAYKIFLTQFLWKNPDEIREISSANTQQQQAALEGASADYQRYSRALQDLCALQETISSINGSDINAVNILFYLQNKLESEVDLLFSQLPRIAYNRLAAAYKQNKSELTRLGRLFSTAKMSTVFPDSDPNPQTFFSDLYSACVVFVNNIAALNHRVKILLADSIYSADQREVISRLIDQCDFNADSDILLYKLKLIRLVCDPASNGEHGLAMIQKIYFRLINYLLALETIDEKKLRELEDILVSYQNQILFAQQMAYLREHRFTSADIDHIKEILATNNGSLEERFQGEGYSDSQLAIIRSLFTAEFKQQQCAQLVTQLGQLDLFVTAASTPAIIACQHRLRVIDRINCPEVHHAAYFTLLQYLLRSAVVEINAERLGFLTRAGILQLADNQIDIIKDSFLIRGADSVIFSEPEKIVLFLQPFMPAKLKIIACHELIKYLLANPDSITTVYINHLQQFARQLNALSPTIDAAELAEYGKVSPDGKFIFSVNKIHEIREYVMGQKGEDYKVWRVIELISSNAFLWDLEVTIRPLDVTAEGISARQALGRAFSRAHFNQLYLLIRLMALYELRAIGEQQDISLIAPDRFNAEQHEFIQQYILQPYIHAASKDHTVLEILFNTFASSAQIGLYRNGKKALNIGNFKRLISLISQSTTPASQSHLREIATCIGDPRIEANAFPLSRDPVIAAVISLIDNLLRPNLFNQVHLIYDVGAKRSYDESVTWAILLVEQLWPHIIKDPKFFKDGGVHDVEIQFAYRINEILSARMHGVLNTIVNMNTLVSFTELLYAQWDSQEQSLKLISLSTIKKFQAEFARYFCENMSVPQLATFISKLLSDSNYPPVIAFIFNEAFVAAFKKKLDEVVDAYINNAAREDLSYIKFTRYFDLLSQLLRLEREPGLLKEIQKSMLDKIYERFINLLEENNYDQAGLLYDQLLQLQGLPSEAQQKIDSFVQQHFVKILRKVLSDQLARSNLETFLRVFVNKLCNDNINEALFAEINNICVTIPEYNDIESLSVILKKLKQIIFEIFANLDGIDKVNFKLSISNIANNIAKLCASPDVSKREVFWDIIMNWINECIHQQSSNRERNLSISLQLILCIDKQLIRNNGDQSIREAILALIVNCADIVFSCAAIVDINVFISHVSTCMPERAQREVNQKLLVYVRSLAIENNQNSLNKLVRFLAEVNYAFNADILIAIVKMMKAHQGILEHLVINAITDGDEHSIDAVFSCINAVINKIVNDAAKQEYRNSCIDKIFEILQLQVSSLNKHNQDFSSIILLFGQFVGRIVMGFNLDFSNSDLSALLARFFSSISVLPHIAIQIFRAVSNQLLDNDLRMSFAAIFVNEYFAKYLQANHFNAGMAIEILQLCCPARKETASQIPKQRQPLVVYEKFKNSELVSQGKEEANAAYEARCVSMRKLFENAISANDNRIVNYFTLVQLNHLREFIVDGFSLESKSKLLSLIDERLGIMVKAELLWNRVKLCEDINQSHQSNPYSHEDANQFYLVAKPDQILDFLRTLNNYFASDDHKLNLMQCLRMWDVYKEIVYKLTTEESAKRHYFAIHCLMLCDGFDLNITSLRVLSTERLSSRFEQLADIFAAILAYNEMFPGIVGIAVEKYKSFIIREVEGIDISSLKTRLTSVYRLSQASLDDIIGELKSTLLRKLDLRLLPPSLAEITAILAALENLKKLTSEDAQDLSHFEEVKAKIKSVCESLIAQLDTRRSEYVVSNYYQCLLIRKSAKLAKVEDYQQLHDKLNSIIDVMVVEIGDTWLRPDCYVSGFDWRRDPSQIPTKERLTDNDILAESKSDKLIESINRIINLYHSVSVLGTENQKNKVKASLDNLYLAYLTMPGDPSLYAASFPGKSYYMLIFYALGNDQQKRTAIFRLDLGHDRPLPDCFLQLRVELDNKSVARQSVDRELPRLVTLSNAKIKKAVVTPPAATPGTNGSTAATTSTSGGGTSYAGSVLPSGAVTPSRSLTASTASLPGLNGRPPASPARNNTVTTRVVSTMGSFWSALSSPTSSVASDKTPVATAAASRSPSSGHLNGSGSSGGGSPTKPQ